MIDHGLVDVHPMVELWGLNEKMKRLHELRSIEDNEDLINTEVSELVFAGDWPAKIQQKHTEDIDNCES